MEKFIQSCLEELQPPQETKNLTGELSSKITDHRGRVRELLRSETLRHPEVIPLIMVGLAADRPLKSNFFPCLLEGLLGSLGIAAPGEGNPPTSSREGAGHAWSTAMREAISQIEQKDLPEVQEVRARILGLDVGEEVTQHALDSSPTFHLRWASDETHPPTVIGVHWIDHLDTEGRIAKCKPHDFKFVDEWLPLYTRAGVTWHVSGLSSLLKTQGDSPLIAVIPPGMLFQSEREYVIHQLHEADCLSWVTVYYGENQQKQIAFCPYCGIMNENTATAYSHARKHLGITLLCGGCYSKLYKAPQHLSQHMRSCPPCLMNRPEGSRRSVRKK